MQNMRCILEYYHILEPGFIFYFCNPSSELIYHVSTSLPTKKSITKLISIIQQKNKHQDLSLNLQRKMLNMKRLMNPCLIDIATQTSIFIFFKGLIMMPSSVISVYNFSRKRKVHVPMTCIDFFFFI